LNSTRTASGNKSGATSLPSTIRAPAGASEKTPAAAAPTKIIIAKKIILNRAPRTILARRGAVDSGIAGPAAGIFIEAREDEWNFFFPESFPPEAVGRSLFTGPPLLGFFAPGVGEEGGVFLFL